MPCEVLFNESDRPVPPSPGRHLQGEILAIRDVPANWGPGELATSLFLRFGVTDKTAAEMEAYMARYRRIYDLQVIAGPNPEGLRRIEVENTIVNNSETLGVWTQEVVDEILTVWNDEHPDSGLISLGFTNRVWTCEGTFTQGEAQEFERVITEAGFNAMDKRTRWYIPPVVVQFVRDQGGYAEGTASQLQLRDATLD